MLRSLDGGTIQKAATMYSFYGNPLPQSGNQQKEVLKKADTLYSLYGVINYNLETIPGELYKKLTLIAFLYLHN